MANLLEAIVRINNLRSLAIKEFYKSRNRINNMGEVLEMFVCDAFADTYDIMDVTQAHERYSQTFSYLGNQNNPPDAILRMSDALEIKKIESFGSSLALNSSYPKNKLYANNPMITNSCRQCEDWEEKDIIYSVGVVNDNTLRGLCFLYGEDYAAKYQTYERIRQTIKIGVDSIPDVEFGDTSELGRVNRVDPLGITHLRIRGMWGIENPYKVFQYVNSADFFALINIDKYNSFPKQSRQLVENSQGIEVIPCKIKNPNNPSSLKSAMLIQFRRT